MAKLWQKLPEAFLDRLKTIVPTETYDDVLDAFSHKRFTTFRINTLKGSRDSIEKRLTKFGFELQKVKEIDGAYSILNKSLRELTETDVYTNGEIYVQSLSSMLPAIILDPKPDTKILDICAAPGSKTTQIAAMMKNSGEILANDMSKIRLYKLEANLAIQGVTNVTIKKGIGETLWREYPEYFDSAIVDVPCSMEGRFFTEDPKSYHNWTPKKVKILSQHQKWILRSAISATKPGGTIVYSTCTLSPEENEGVINWILKKERGTVSLETISWQNASSSQTLRILPSKVYEGFFIAKFKKISSNIPHFSF